MAEISTRFCGLELRNPLILASGILGETGELLLRATEMGAGALVTKSIGLQPREGNPNPTVVELDCGLLNSIGLANPGIESFAEELEVARKAKIPLIGSIFGKDEKEFGEVASRMESYQVDAIELNLSCPHVQGFGLEVGGDPDLVYDIVKAVRDSVKIPVFAKLSSMVRDIAEIAKSVQKARGDGITAINTVGAMSIAPEIGRPVLGSRIGGLSGKAIKPIGVRCVYEISRAVDLPIIGVGGIETGLDAVEYFMAGASAVQIGSAVYFRGDGVFEKICEEILQFMEAHGYDRIEEMVGIAHGKDADG